MAEVQLLDITRQFKAVVALDRISLEIREGEFVSLLGPSGCGKTTTLRIVAGLIEPTSGSVLIGGRPVTHVPVHRRNLGMVFQQYALFPHMTVARNVAFGLEMRDLPRAEIEARVEQALALVKLAGLEDRYPRQLSGGQQQRVALARALAVKPAVLLLDEPFGALDRKLRIDMQRELRELQRELGITALFVTHDQEEALSLSDRIAVLNHGRLEQFGTPVEIYERPATPFVADFIGSTNLLDATCAGRDGDRTVVVTAGGLRIVVPVDARLASSGSHVTVTVRPEKIRLASGGAAREGTNAARGKIASFTYLGGATHYDVRLETGETVKVVEQNARTLATAAVFNAGDEVLLAWDVDATRLLHS